MVLAGKPFGYSRVPSEGGTLVVCPISRWGCCQASCQWCFELDVFVWNGGPFISSRCLLLVLGVPGSSVSGLSLVVFTHIAVVEETDRSPCWGMVLFS